MSNLKIVSTGFSSAHLDTECGAEATFRAGGETAVRITLDSDWYWDAGALRELAEAATEIAALLDNESK